MFEVVMQYRGVESNPNGEGLMDSFKFMMDSMLDLVKEPSIKSCLLGLKGLAGGLISSDTTLHRDLRLGMLLNPSSREALHAQ